MANVRPPNEATSGEADQALSFEELIQHTLPRVEYFTSPTAGNGNMFSQAAIVAAGPNCLAVLVAGNSPPPSIVMNRIRQIERGDYPGNINTLEGRIARHTPIEPIKFKEISPAISSEPEVRRYLEADIQAPVLSCLRRFLDKIANVTGHHPRTRYYAEYHPETRAGDTRCKLDGGVSCTTRPRFHIPGSPEYTHQWNDTWTSNIQQMNRAGKFMVIAFEFKGVDVLSSDPVIIPDGHGSRFVDQAWQSTFEQMRFYATKTNCRNFLLSDGKRFMLVTFTRFEPTPIVIDGTLLGTLSMPTRSTFQPLRRENVIAVTIDAILCQLARVRLLEGFTNELNLGNLPY